MLEQFQPGYVKPQPPQEPKRPSDINFIHFPSKSIPGVRSKGQGKICKGEPNAKYRGPRLRKYAPGDNQCHYCQIGDHKKCRPKLDGTLCSCACETATMARQMYIMDCQDNCREGKPFPTVIESAERNGYSRTLRTFKRNAQPEVSGTETVSSGDIGKLCAILRGSSV